MAEPRMQNAASDLSSASFSESKKSRSSSEENSPSQSQSASPSTTPPKPLTLEPAVTSEVKEEKKEESDREIEKRTLSEKIYFFDQGYQTLKRDIMMQSRPFKVKIILDAESDRDKMAIAFQAIEPYLDFLSTKTRLEQPEKFKEATTRVFELLNKADAALATELATGISDPVRLKKIGVVQGVSDSLRRSINHHINIGDHIYQMYQAEQAQRVQQEIKALEDQIAAKEEQLKENQDALKASGAQLRKFDDGFYDALQKNNPTFKGVERVYLSDVIDQKVKENSEFRQQILGDAVDARALIIEENTKLVVRTGISKVENEEQQPNASSSAIVQRALMPQSVSVSAPAPIPVPVRKAEVKKEAAAPKTKEPSKKPDNKGERSSPPRDLSSTQQGQCIMM